MLICWESVFGDIALEAVRAGARVLRGRHRRRVVRDERRPDQHAQATTLRAVETGRWIVRAASTGISGIVAPDGTGARAAGSERRRTIVGEIGAPVATSYTRFGPQPVGLAALAFVLLALDPMAPEKLARLRVGAALIAAAVLGWIAWQTVHAGGDIPSQRTQAQTQLSGGSANDKRLDGKSWSLDYDKATLSPDGSLAEIDNVHNGLILRNGKPYMRMTAKHVSANLASTISSSAVRFRSPRSADRTPAVHRPARLFGSDHTLHLDPHHDPRQRHDVHVASAVVNFATGETKLGRITGSL